MIHSIEDLIRRINVMHDKALQLHRLRNEFSEISGKEYDKITCNQILGDIQTIALLIANDREGQDIITEMEYKQERYHDYMSRMSKE